ncbi:MAG: helix-turn-helix domain-containing protein [Lachnospiraceae bacterium]|nr:helix-turn-helix domain-containing protein [Lachnospiraceae bacterium]
MKKRYEDGVVPRSSSEARQEAARQLKEARLEVNLTQQVLADRSGTQKSNISRMESGKYNPTLDFLVKVAGSMGKRVVIRIE